MQQNCKSPVYFWLHQKTYFVSILSGICVHQVINIGVTIWKIRPWYSNRISVYYINIPYSTLFSTRWNTYAFNIIFRIWLRKVNICIHAPLIFVIKFSWQVFIVKYGVYAITICPDVSASNQTHAVVILFPKDNHAKIWRQKLQG